MDLLDNRARCILRPALTAIKRLKFRFNQAETDQYTAKTATVNANNSRDKEQII